MTSKRLSLLAGLLLLQFFILPMERVNSQSPSSELARVISLAATGNERANAVAFSPDGRHLAAAASAGIYLFDPQTLSQEEFIPTDAWTRTLTVSPDGKFLAAGLSDEKALLLNFPEMNQPIHQFIRLGGWVRSIAFTPDGQFIAAAAGDSIRLWRRVDGDLVLTIDDLAGVRAIAISPDGETLAVGLQDNSIQIRSLLDGSLSSILVGHEGWIRCLAFSPDGSRLASGAFDATARLWDVPGGKLLYTLMDHQSSVLGIAFSPDGATLATGSVDQTVRLWNASDGVPLRTLVGHGGFVYSVAFSPDGQVLASGANDNTVRLWDLNSTGDPSPEVPETPSDCRVCHHPVNNASPVAVVDVRCDACHPDGLGVNWCPFFSRSGSEASKMEIHAASHEQTGVPVPGRTLAVTIFSPANGEVLYSYSEYVAPFQVTGKVESSSPDLDPVEVQLEIWAGAQMLSSLSKPLQPNGQFSFNLGVNPDGHMLRINDPAAPFNCAYCHDDFYVEARVPAGDIRLRVLATTSDGDQAMDERRISTDVSTTLSQEIHLTDVSSGEPVSGLTIQAATLLYEWRGRTSTAITHENGAANLSLEVLSEAPTLYEIQIPDQVVNGIFYSAQHTTSLLVQPQTSQLEPVELKVQSQKGQIRGTFKSDARTAMVIWAVQLPAGPAFQTETDTSGSFSFVDIPVARYAIFAESEMMAKQHLTGSQTGIDLTQSPTGKVELEAHSTDAFFAGKAAGSDGAWLPFTWLLASDQSILFGDIRSGDWLGAERRDQSETWILTAPGYYSQEVSSAGETMPALLQRRSDTKRVPWGVGEITVPSETKAEIAPGKIDFDTGWIWGMNGENQPLTVQTDEAEIHLSSGQFALERHAGGTSWFYLFAGQAELYPTEGRSSMSIKAGQMVALSGMTGFSPMPYQPEILPALRSVVDVPISPRWEPTLAEKLQNLSIQIGVILAQLVTFITYFVAVISLVGIPWWAIRWMSKHRKFPGEKNESL